MRWFFADGSFAAIGVLKNHIQVFFYLCGMKRILHTWLLIVLVMAGCAKQECGFLTPINSEDEEYALFLDSLEVLISDYNCYQMESNKIMTIK